MSKEVINTKVCIVGGGPAGIMASYLLAKNGIEVTVVEKYPDFFRDFRGDTIHPSTMKTLDELDLLNKFLKINHQKSHKLAAYVNGKRHTIVDFNSLKSKTPYIAFMPQWDFLNFLSGEGKKFNNFNLMMETEAKDVIEENGKITGIKAKSKGKALEIRADLIIGADGRDSIIREKSNLKIKSSGSPMDVLWFSLPRKDSDPEISLGHVRAGKFMVMIERDTYWQCGYLIPKGSFEDFKKRGIKEFHKDIQKLVQMDGSRFKDISDWKDVKLLSVTVNHMEKWYREGLLCIGDAAHAMSPIAGIGINLAIQDAVAAARILTPYLKKNEIEVNALKKVQDRRMFPARIYQKLQVFLQNKVIEPILDSRDLKKPSIIFRLLNKFSFLRRIPAYLIGVGIRTEHVE